MTTVRIENAAYLVTVNDADDILTDATITVTDGVITAIDSGTAAQQANPERGPSLGGTTRATEPEAAAEQADAERGPSLRPLAGTGGSDRVRAAGEGADGLRPHEGPRGADPTAEPDPTASHTAADPASGPTASDVTVIDASGKLVLPGLVNLHTHLPMTLLRGLAENLDLDGFLQRLWAAESAVMDPESVELGATLGALESLLGGCTTQLDMYFHHDAAHRGAVSAGSRHVIGPVFFDGPGPDGLAWAQRLENLRAWPALLDEIGGPDVPVAAMPHATYTCSPDGLTEVLSVLREALADTDRDGALTTHVSETAAENAGIRERYDATPTELLGRTGWLSAGLPLVLAHGVHLSAADRVGLAGAGAAVAHCPGSNLKLASGALPWEAVRDSGVRLGLGTDGCSSSNDLDMWQAMRQAALLARLTSARPDVASATEVLRAATIEGACALGMGDRIGSVEVGKRADLVLVDLAAPHLTPVHDVAALLVFAAGRGDVSDVLVDGRPVVRDRRSTLLDTDDLLARARSRGAVARAAVTRTTATRAETEMPS